MKRMLVPGAAEGRLQLTGAGFHHLAVVLRAGIGDVIEAFDGAGTSFTAKVLTIEDTFVTLQLSEPRVAALPRRVTVVQGLPKADKLELVLQKGTELGASAFLPAPAIRSVARLEGKLDSKLERWRRIIEEAARQCGRADVPHLLEPTPLSAFSLPDTTVLVLDEVSDATIPLSHCVRALPSDRPLALVIGPEGGLDRAEVEALTSRGAQRVTLGKNVLRTETAALAALSVIRHLDGWLG